MILNEFGIENNSTFYAHWEIEEKVPQTSDAITIMKILGIVSLIGIVGTSLFLKKAKLKISKLKTVNKNKVC